MTGMTFNGARVFSDRDRDDCRRYALMVGLDNGSHYDTTDDEERCLEERWQVAIENAHDEWWDNSAPERWEEGCEYGPWVNQGEPLPRAA